jgi:acetylornithine deacetylase
LHWAAERCFTYKKIPNTRMTVIDLCKKLVSFPSLSTQERDLADWLEAYLSGTGYFKVERMGDNLLVHYGEGSPWLLLNSHSDVVPPSPNHEGEPFHPQIRDGKLYGRGTTDAKGSGSAMITAMIELARERFRPKGRVSMALTVCEEADGHNNGMAFLRKHIPKPDAAIIGEPTSLAPCLAQKGLLILEVNTYGLSGHAARVTGPNAILEMAEVLARIGHIRLTEVNEFVGGMKVTPTVITGGTAKNANPEKCSLILDIRTIPEITVAEIVERVKLALGAEVRVVSDRYVSTFTDKSEPVAQAALTASGKPFFGSPTSSDWVFLADVPAVKIGPGHSEVSHTRDEHIALEQLTMGVDVYKKLIRDYFHRMSSL